MSGGGFFRGTSADQDTRFSNKQAKLLKTQKFPPELDHLVDMTKVKLDVIRPWIANRTTEILGFEDEVLINLIYGHLDGKEVDGKQIQIQITGFLEKNTGKFMKELWNLLLSAQQNASGIPQQFLDAKAEQLRKKQADKDRVESELKKVEELSREREQAKDSKIVADLEAVKTTTKDPENSNLSSKKDLLSLEKSTAERRRSSLPRRKNEDSKISHRGNHDADRSSRSRSRSHSYAPSRSRSRSPPLARRRRSRSTSRPRYRHRETSPAARRRRRRRSPLGSPVRRKHVSPYGWSPRRRSPSPRRRRPSSPPRRRSPSSSPSPPLARRRRSPSPALRRLRRSRSPAIAIAMRRRSRSPLIPSRRRSPSPLHALKRRRTPSPPPPMRRRSPSPSPSPSHSPPMRRRSSPASPPVRRHRSPPSSPPLRRHRSSPSPLPSPSPSLRRTSPPHSPPAPAPAMQLPPSPSLNKRYYSPSQSPCVSRSPSPVARQKLSPFGKRHSPSPSPSPSPRHHELSPGSLPRNDVDPQSPSNHQKSTHGRRQSRMHDSQETSEEDRDSLESPAERRKYNELSKGKNTEATYVSERIEHGSRKTDTSKGVASAYKNQHSHEISEPRRKSSHSQNIVDYSRKNAVEGPALEDVEYGPGRLVHGTHLADEPNNGATVRRQKMSSMQVENESNDLAKPRKSLSNKRHANDLMNSVDDKSKMKHHIHNGSDSDVEENRENRRKHSKKRKSRRDEDDESMSSEDRREAKRKRKEEKRLRREEKRRHREEKHRRREERRARRSKAKVGAERDMEPEKDYSSEEQMQHDHKEVESYHKSNDEVEDEQRRLEIELRRKALESLRAKKGISHWSDVIG